MPPFGSRMFWVVILVAMIPLAIPLVVLLITFMVSMADKAEANSLSPSASLTCYHCGNETDSSRKTCIHCGGELQ